MSIARNRRFDPGGAGPALASRDAFGPRVQTLQVASAPHPTPTPRRAGLVWATVLAVAGLWIVLNVRYGYQLEDSVLYLPIAKQQLHPELYPDNPLLEHLRRMPYPLYHSMGRLLGTRLGLDAHVLAAVAMRLAFVGMLLGLMTELTGRRWTGVVAALAVVLQPVFYGTLAWTELISPEFVQGDLGKIALMAAVIAYVRGKVVLTAAVLGLGFNVHPIFTVAAAAMLAPDAVWRWRRFGTWRMIAALGVGVALAGPTALDVVRSLSLSIASRAPDHAEMIRFFNYFHVFPSQFHRWEYVGFLGLAGAGAVAFAMRADRLGERRGMILRMALGMAIWFGVGVLLVEVWPHALTMQMMPFRLTYAVRLLATALVVIAALDVMRHHGRGSFVLAGLWLGAAIVSVKYVPWVTVAVAFWLVVTRRNRWSIMALVASVAAAGAVVWIDPAQVPSLDNVPWPAILVMLVSLILLRTERKTPPPDAPASRGSWPVTPVGRLAWIAAVVVAGLLDVTQTTDGVWQPRLLAKPWRSPAGYDVEHDPWQATMRWARTHTEPHEAFITPPDLIGWTCYSERNTLASYHLGMQSVWDRHYAPIASERLAVLGGVAPWAPGANYHAFAPDRLLDVARAYDVSFVVWKRSEPRRMPWPVVYENAGFLVYDVRARAPESQPRTAHAAGGEAS